MKTFLSLPFRCERVVYITFVVDAISDRPYLTELQMQLKHCAVKPTLNDRTNPYSSLWLQVPYKCMSLLNIDISKTPPIECRHQVYYM